MTQMRAPRRPAMLEPARAEAIVGDEDPAQASAVAHASAWALMGVGDADFGPDALARLAEVIRTDGVDVIASVWSRSPEFTLPGALWRLYLLDEWYRRDPRAVERRHDEGMRADIIPGLEHPVDIRPLGEVMDEIGALLAGRRTDDDLDAILDLASRAMRVLAAGDSLGASWIDDPRDPLAHPVTTRARALLRTAEELDAAARQAAIGALD
ncbi:hypothetical protein M3T53_01105 [Actinomyces sp. B33]|uniref:hypothetical protein n=1 Tax=Actinomyces sp. B33 TaxID=2942131 RepID=UPI00233FE6AD|nr:hypothetical protein [Actinomyces sp. B33]MDC4232314.1 hypothetical protein [Actinomyces sp. B33]